MAYIHMLICVTFTIHIYTHIAFHFTAYLIIRVALSALHEARHCFKNVIAVCSSD